MSNNRIAEYAATIQARLDSGVKPDGSPLADLAALERDLDLSVAEHHAYQNAQARAHASGDLSTDEALTVYNALGEGGGWPEDTSLALKVTVTTLMGQLLTR